MWIAQVCLKEMSTLWEKESNIGEFVDLFAKNAGFKEWDRLILAADWKHSFLMSKYKAGKSNKVSDTFRAEGNTYFKMGYWIEAMELYNQSLLFAEPATNNVSFAIANRAACFINMKAYEKSLKDIELAMDAGYPANLHNKLMKRKADCLKLQGNHTPPKPFCPKLSFDASEEFPCMANVLEIQKNDEFGRHIVAKCDIDVGQTVLVEQNFVSITSALDRANCATCLLPTQTFIACPGCSDVLYCDENCQKNDAIHGQICGANIHRMPNNVKFIAKSILIAIAAFANADEFRRLVQARHG